MLAGAARSSRSSSWASYGLLGLALGLFTPWPSQGLLSVRPRLRIHLQDEEREEMIRLTVAGFLPGRTASAMPPSGPSVDLANEQEAGIVIM